MLVWRTSLGRSHRYRMFSVVVPWTNNKDPTSDKGIWLHGTEWEAQCRTRGCPSREEPFSTLGTDIKAVSTLLKSSHIHTHKDIHAHKHTCVPVYTQPHTYTMQEVCLSRTHGEGRQQKHLSVDRNKKNNSWKRVCVKRVRDKGIRSVRTHHSAEGRYVREMQPYERCHCPPKHKTGEGTGWWRADYEAGKPSLKTFHINRDIGRLLKFKCVWDTGIHSSLRTG